MAKTTELEALKIISSQVKVVNKTIMRSGSLTGLKACSAYDFLRNHCGYITIWE